MQSKNVIARHIAIISGIAAKHATLPSCSRKNVIARHIAIISGIAAKHDISGIAADHHQRHCR